MNAEVETCANSNFHMAHYWASNQRYCNGIYRELADAVRAWNELIQSTGSSK